AAEVRAVEEARVGPGADAVAGGKGEGREGRARVAGVPAAGDVGGRDQPHQFVVVGAALAEVAVQVNLHRASPPTGFLEARVARTSRPARLPALGACGYFQQERGA